MAATGDNTGKEKFIEAYRQFNNIHEAYLRGDVDEEELIRSERQLCHVAPNRF